MLNDFNATKVKDACVQWICDWFKTNGDGCNAVIGISGGKDSSIVAALCCEAIGKDRVIGVLMPNGEQSDIKDARELCEFFNIRSIEIDIHEAVSAVLNGIRFGIYDNVRQGFDTLNITNQTRTNLPARIRMSTLYAVAQSANGRVANTCNLSEDWIGYSTRWGDGVGDFSPLAQLTSDEVVAIGDACGLPHHLTHKTPADGLCGKTDEDNFGFTYAELNKYIRTGVCENDEAKIKIDFLHQKNLFKLQPIPSFPYKHTEQNN